MGERRKQVWLTVVENPRLRKYVTALKGGAVKAWMDVAVRTPPDRCMHCEFYEYGVKAGFINPKREPKPSHRCTDRRNDHHLLSAVCL